MMLQVVFDRSCYHYRIERSIRYKQTLSLVVDGAEMSRYGLPYFCQTDKETTLGWKFPTRLYGSILHGEFASAFVFPAHLTGGSNVTIEVIHRSVDHLIFIEAHLIVFVAFPPLSSMHTNERIFLLHT